MIRIEHQQHENVSIIVRYLSFLNILIYILDIISFYYSKALFTCTLYSSNFAMEFLKIPVSKSPSGINFRVFT